MKLEYGKIYKINKRYKRTKKWVLPNSITWHTIETTVQNAIFLGYRTIYEDHIIDCPRIDGRYMRITDKIKAAYMSINSRTNPIYVPLGAIEI